MTSEIGSFGITLLINIVIGAVGMGIFLFMLPRREKYGWALIPRMSDLATWRNPVNLATPPMEVPTNFSELMIFWKHMWSCKTVEVFDYLGMDAAFMLRFFKVMTLLFAAATVFGCAVILPINAYADTIVEDPEAETSDFNGLTMANLAVGSSAFWAHAFGMYLVVFGLLWLIRTELASYYRLRHRFFLPSNRSIVLWPTSVRLETPDALNAFVSKYFTSVSNVELVVETKALGKLLDKRDEISEKLSKVLLVDFDSSIPAQHRKSMFSLEKVDSIPTYKQEIADLNEKIAALQAKAPEQPILGAVITFETIEGASALPRYISEGMGVIHAPRDHDICYDAIALTKEQRNTRGLVGSIVTFSMVAFYMIPIVFVSSMTTLSKLTKTFPFLKPILDTNFAVKGFLEGFLPTLALVVFLAILPGVLKLLARHEGQEISESGLERAVLTKYFYFQFFNVFLASVTAGSLLGSLEKIVDHPASTVDLLAQSLPEFSTFFMAYIMLATFSAFPLKLSQVVKVVVGSLKKKYLCKTQKDIDAAEEASESAYGAELAEHVLFTVIALSYAVISPLILVFAICYYLFAFATFSFQFTFNIPVRHEGGGSIYPMLWSRVVCGLIVSEVLMIGYFGIKEAPAQATLMIPLVVLTLGFYNMELKKGTDKWDYLTREEVVNFRELKVAEESFKNPRLAAKVIDLGSFVVNDREGSNDKAISSIVQV